MKIALTGGGSGGHFYPLIAVAESLNQIAQEERLLALRLYYLADAPYDTRALFDNQIEFRKISAGKTRRYFSIKNYTDVFKTALGILEALIQLFTIFPDVVFSKGGFVSFPVVFAARILRIPVVIHESDSTPGRANLWAGKFAARIAISYPETANHFPKEKVALTGSPVRKGIKVAATEGAIEFLNLDKDVPTILVLGGSQGSERINQTILDALPELVEHYNVIHQTGRANFDEVKIISTTVLRGNEKAYRYKPFDYLNDIALRMAAGAATIIVSRAGSGTIFEIATWGRPSIIIPIPETISHDQRHNAFAYARSGAADVVEEKNLTPHLLVAEINKLSQNAELREKMSLAAKHFARPDAEQKIAREIINIALQHEN